MKLLFHVGCLLAAVNIMVKTTSAISIDSIEKAVAESEAELAQTESHLEAVSPQNVPTINIIDVS